MLNGALLPAGAAGPLWKPLGGLCWPCCRCTTSVIAVHVRSPSIGASLADARDRPCLGHHGHGGHEQRGQPARWAEFLANYLYGFSAAASASGVFRSWRRTGLVARRVDTGLAWPICWPPPNSRGAGRAAPRRLVLHCGRSRLHHRGTARRSAVGVQRGDVSRRAGRGRLSRG